MAGGGLPEGGGRDLAGRGGALTSETNFEVVSLSVRNMGVA